jgi:hypothetical protein
MGSRRAIAAAMLALALGLSGCGGVDDVQFNGKIFDALGVSDGSGKKSAEPKMVARSGIVMPPAVDRLPEPGKPTGSEIETATIASLNDPDKKVVLDKADLERQQREYCKVHYEQAKQHGDPEAELAKGPLGPCKGSALNLLKGLVNNSKEGEGQEGQVEQE